MVKKVLKSEWNTLEKVDNNNKRVVKKSKRNRKPMSRSSFTRIFF